MNDNPAKLSINMRNIFYLVMKKIALVGFVISISFLVGLLILFGAVIFNPSLWMSVPGIIYLTCSALVCLLYIYYSAKKDGDFFSPSVFIPMHYFVWMILGAFILYFSHTFLDYEQEILIPMLILVGLLSFIMGQNIASIIFILFKPRIRKGGFSKSGYNISKEKITSFFVIALILGGYFYLKNFDKLYFSPEGIENSRISIMFGQGYIYNFVMTLTYIIPLYISIIWIYGKKINLADIFVIFAGSFILLLSLHRGPIVWMIIYVIFMYHYLRKEINFKIALTFFFFLFLLGIIISVMRTPQLFFPLILAEIKVHCYNLSFYLKHLRIIGPPMYFEPYLMSFRMLLPGHQPDLCLWLKDIFHLNFPGGGASVTLIGELYIAGRMFFLVFGFCFVGFLSKYIYLMYLYKRTTRLLAMHMIIMYHFCSAIAFGIHKDLISVLWVILLIFLLYPSRYITKDEKFENALDRQG